jgi:flagellar hook assembly protein FlgD
MEEGDTLQVTVTQDYEIEDLSLDGREVAVYEFAGSSGVDPGDNPARTGLHLEGGSPNPFARSTTIRYSLPARAHVRLGVYNVAGQEVAVLKDAEHRQGPHEVKWEGSDSDGQDLVPGIYFLQLDAGDETRTSKVMLLR